MIRTGTRLALLLLLFAEPVTAQDTKALKRWKTPRRFTIKAKKITVGDALAKLKQRTGVTVTADASKRNYKIALSLEKVTLFEALDEIAQRAGLALSVRSRGFRANSLNDNWRLAKRPDGMKRIPPVLRGPLRMEVLGVYSSHSGARRFSPNATEESDEPLTLRVEMRCLLEPDLAGLFLSHIELIHVTDDRERSLIDAREFSNLGRTIALRLRALGRGALKIQELRGKLVVYIPGKIEQVKFGGGSRNSTKKLGAATIKVHRIEKSSYKRANLQVTLTGRPCAAVRGKTSLRLMTSSYGSFRNAPPAPTVIGIYAFDRNGEAIGGSMSTIRSMLNENGMQTVRLDKMPSKIIVKAITQAERFEVPFRFQDLPIPR